MQNRRDFLKCAASAAGLMFVGCGPANAVAHSQSAGTSVNRAPVMIKGRRIRTVDMHAHCAVPKAADLLKQQLYPPTLVLDGEALSERLMHMGAQRIDMAVLSVNPNWYGIERDLATQVIDVQNDALAEFCAAHADRFAALASVALQFPDLAADQLEHAMNRKGLRGVAIGGSVAGQELADPKFHPFWAKAEALGALVFIHPQASEAGGLGGRLQGNGALQAVLWNPLETTIALSHLIFEGTLDRFPGLKILAAHGGGYLPSYMHRSDRGCEAFPMLCTPGVPRQRPSEYMKRLYYDSLVFTPEALRHLVAEVGATQIVMGTDYPFPWVSDPVGHILDTPGLTDVEREALLGATARALLGLAPANQEQQLAHSS